MGNALSSSAEVDAEDCINLALAVALSQQPEPVQPASAAPEQAVDLEGEAMAAAVAEAAALYLRRCRSCGEQSYLRQGVCLNPSCTESYLALNPGEVGTRLQSWGKPDGSQK